jgi:hypothetical protein
MRLRRVDGAVYLDRWGVEWKPLGGIFLHKMDAPDPGLDVHDHPWWFVSIILAGGYDEERSPIREAPSRAARAAEHDARPGARPPGRRGVLTYRRPLSVRVMRLDEAHRIVRLHRRRSWSLVVHGPTRRGWGFYLPSGWMPWREYDATVRADRRDLWAEISSNDPPGTRR